ncbi:hypothetical protein JCM16303_001038 [Sporobolomyces ruberrimus]
MQATRPSNTAPASHGSRTLTVTSSPAQPDASSSASSTPSDGVLRLRGSGMPGNRVQWTDETIDNEGLNRKKSKICCIYHKPKEFDESSDESSTDGEDSDGSADSRQERPQRTRRHRHHRHHHDHDGDCEHGEGSTASGQGGTMRSGGGSSQTVVELPHAPIPNAYERQPATGGGGSSSGKGKGKA